MVGWSRRSREARERRAKWWASLSEEERGKARLAQEKEDHQANIIMVAIMAVLLGVLLVAKLLGGK